MDMHGRFAHGEIPNMSLTNIYATFVYARTLVCSVRRCERAPRGGARAQLRKQRANRRPDRGVQRNSNAAGYFAPVRPAPGAALGDTNPSAAAAVARDAPSCLIGAGRERTEARARPRAGLRERAPGAP